MGRLHDSLLAALHRGLDVLMLTHDVEDLSTLASASLEALRRGSAGLPGSFAVFSALAMPQVFLHLKIVMADDEWVVVGSANVTGKGFGANMEAGVVLGRDAASEVRRVIQGLVASGLVQRVYCSSD